MEATAIAGGVMILIGGLKLVKKIGYKKLKRKLKKGLFKSFEKLDYDDMKTAISSLIDFDSKHGTKKLKKYLLPIVKEFRDNEDKLNINVENLNKAVDDFSLFSTIFDETDEEIFNNAEILDDALTQIEKKRREVILRKNEIKTNQIIKNKKIKRRGAGGMG